MMVDTKALKGLVADGQIAKAFAGLCAALAPEADFPNQHRLIKLFKAMPRDSLGLKPLRLAVLGTSTLDHLIDALELYLAAEGFDATFFTSEFNTLHQTVLDPASPLWSFDPDLVWLFTSHRDVTVNLPPGADLDAVASTTQLAVNDFTDLWRAIGQRSRAFIIQNNADLPFERPFGNFEGAVAWSRLNVLRRFNLNLAEAAIPGVTIFDLDHVAASVGRLKWTDERYWNHSKHAFALDAVGAVAFAAARLVRGIKGLARKCLVLDLDNTLWGGIIGDDGLEGIRLGQGSAEGEAFLSFQRYVKALKDRGIILAVCSKNEMENAELPFRHHPEMALSLDDIAMFVANWNNKADNIRTIAETLDIGLDSLVFIDDNPAERAQVLAELPMVAVPEMPADPSFYVRILDGQLHLETVAFSDEDRSRGTMYRENTHRKVLAGNCSNIEEFLRDLEMEAEMAPIDALTLPRAAQLINKSNQFHLTTTRYTTAEIRSKLDTGTLSLTFRLRDRFGDNGLIAVVLLDPVADGLDVDTWVMSCRVLSRGMEEFIHNAVVKLARQREAGWVTGTYLPSRKNSLVKDLYSRLGWRRISEADGIVRWRLDLNCAQTLPTFVQATQPR
jgi:FkbH-like protein